MRRRHHTFQFSPFTFHIKKQGVSKRKHPILSCIRYKPSSVPLSRPLSFIYDCGHPQPLATYPPTLDEQPLIVGIRGLATHETHSRGVLLPSRWALTPPSHPYPCGRLFSSTLLYPHGYQAVNLRGALCCSDFPPPPCGGSDRAQMRGKGNTKNRNSKTPIQTKKRPPKESFFVYS